MEIITWKTPYLSGRRFEFENNNLMIGTFTILGELGSNASFSSGENLFRFNKRNFWESHVVIKKNNKLIGKIRSRFLGGIELSLNEQKTFHLSSNFFGRNLKWLGADGRSVVEYKMPTLQSMRKGFVQVDESLTKDEKDVLLSGGLFANQLNTYKWIAASAFFGFVLVLISRF